MCAEGTRWEGWDAVERRQVNKRRKWGGAARIYHPSVDQQRQHTEVSSEFQPTQKGLQPHVVHQKALRTDSGSASDRDGFISHHIL